MNGQVSTMMKYVIAIILGIIIIVVSVLVFSYPKIIKSLNQTLSNTTFITP